MDTAIWAVCAALCWFGVIAFFTPIDVQQEGYRIEKARLRGGDAEADRQRQSIEKWRPWNLAVSVLLALYVTWGLYTSVS